VRVCDAALLVLRETDNPAVMWGDCGLLDMIARRAGLKWKTGVTWAIADMHTRVLNALSNQPGKLVPGKTIGGNGRRLRIFHLPEWSPKMIDIRDRTLMLLGDPKLLETYPELTMQIYELSTQPGGWSPELLAFSVRRLMKVRQPWE
jgi:hypothetical protein